MNVLNKVNNIYKCIKQVVQNVFNLLQWCGYINKSLKFCSNILDNSKHLTNKLSNRCRCKWVQKNQYINKSKCLIGNINSQALDKYMYYQRYKNSLQYMMNQGNANILSDDFAYGKID